jgi:POT family proton-dependent oligopeptide transporter
MSTPIDGATTEPLAETPGRQIFGHPFGLVTLFFTEMWERFSFYGLRALLILYMTAPLLAGADNPNPGLGFDAKKAALIYSLYASTAYATPLIGGWIADRFLGARRATLIGGIIIASGHFTMAYPSVTTFYVGLILVATGTGFLKSNVSTMVGDLYKPGDPRRDAGFSIFYMGINLGAFLAPLLCGALGQKVNWHYGFGLAGIGMTLGLLQYTIFGKSIRHVGLPPKERPIEPDAPAQAPLGVGYVVSLLVLTAAAVSLIVYLGINFLMPITLLTGLIAVLITGMQDRLTGNEWRRLAMIAVLFLFACLFWGGFEQGATSLNLFADRLTRMPVIFGWSMPSTWFQSINSIFIIALAPVFSIIWQAMGKRQPSDPIKFALGLFSLGLGFLVVAYAASLVTAGKVGPGWLIAVYFFHTIGELCVSPVGLSSMTKLAPLRMAGLMMGVWFISISMGNYVAGQIAGGFEPTQEVLVSLFTKVALTVIAGAVVLALLSPFMNRFAVQRAEPK